MTKPTEERRPARQVDAIPRSWGIDGFGVTAADEREEIVEVAMETTVAAACCPHCAHADGNTKERKPRSIRDVRSALQADLAYLAQAALHPRTLLQEIHRATCSVAP
jgi:hypothetical protein